MSVPFRYTGYQSVFIAFIGMVLFTTSLVFMVTLDLRTIPIWTIPIGTIWMTLMYTALFITVHDSMHGSILPHNPRLNNFIGTMSIFFYALFSYKKLKEKHFEHHKHPATLKDPDFHDGKHRGFFSWYFRFMRNYLSPYQLIGIILVFIFLVLVLRLRILNLWLFWAIPSIGSTFQLFFFGTYLPHREPPGGYTNKHHARSSNYPYVISLLTCFHFGYHLEHHEYPYVQWWRLPRVRKRLLMSEDLQR